MTNWKDCLLCNWRGERTSGNTGGRIGGRRVGKTGGRIGGRRVGKTGEDRWEGGRDDR